MDKHERVKALRQAIVIINSGTMIPEPGMDVEATIFGYCQGCGVVEYKPHEPGCVVVNTIRKLEQMIAEDY